MSSAKRSEFGVWHNFRIFHAMASRILDRVGHLISKYAPITRDIVTTRSKFPYLPAYHLQLLLCCVPILPTCAFQSANHLLIDRLWYGTSNCYGYFTYRYHRYPMRRPIGRAYYHCTKLNKILANKWYVHDWPPKDAIDMNDGCHLGFHKNLLHRLTAGNANRTATTAGNLIVIMYVCVSERELFSIIGQLVLIKCGCCCGVSFSAKLQSTVSRSIGN